MRKEKIMFISDFLIPNLNEERFAERLMWIDKEQAKFQLYWNHKSAPNWTKFDVEVFIEWDKQKGHYNPNQKDYYSLCKQRFRALLYKMTTQKQLVRWKSNNKNLRVYSISKREDKEYKRKYTSGGKNKLNYLGEQCENYFEKTLIDFTKAEEMITISRVQEDHKYQRNLEKAEYMLEDQNLEHEVLHSPSSPSLYAASTQVEKNIPNPDFYDVNSPSSGKELNSLYMDLSIIKNETEVLNKVTENIQCPVSIRKVCLLSEEQKSLDIVPGTNNTSIIPAFILYYNIPQEGKFNVNEELNTCSVNQLIPQDFTGNLSSAGSPEYSSNFQTVRLFGNEYTETYFVGENGCNRLEDLGTFINKEDRSGSDMESSISGANEISFSGDESTNSNSDIISDVSLNSAASPLNGIMDEQVPPVFFAWPVGVSS